DLRSYIRRALAGQPTAFQSETLPPEERAQETLALNLRRAEGVVRRQFLEQTGFDVDAVAGPAIRRHVELGFLDDPGEAVRLTRRGKCVADAVIRELL